MDGLRKAIAIDFDGCLCTDAYPKIGEPNWPVIYRAKAEQKGGAGRGAIGCTSQKRAWSGIRRNRAKIADVWDF